MLSLTYSLLWGAGAGFANHAATVLIQKTFHEKLSLANGIVSSGSGLGALVLGQIITWMLQKLGYQWTFRACALLPLSFCVLLYSNHVRKKHDQEMGKIETESNDDEAPDKHKLIVKKDGNNNNTMMEVQTPPKLKSFNINELIDKELWYNLKYIVLVIGVSIFLFGAFIPFVFLVSLFKLFTRKKQEKTCNTLT